MNDLLLMNSQVFIKTVNVVISRCFFFCFFAEDGIQLFLSACRLLIIPKSTNQIINLWRCRHRSILVVDDKAP